MSKELVAQVLENLQGREFGNRPLPAKESLNQRLNELLEGRRVPVVTFQCIDFEWIAAEEGKYPKATAKTDLAASICGFCENDLLEITKELLILGAPQLFVIIPDSELYDDRPFSFAQSLRERQQMALDYQIALPNRLPRICDAGGSVIFWSEYCKLFELPSAQEYTTINRYKIRQNAALESKVEGQAKDSRKFFVRNGLDPAYIAGIPSEEIEEKVGWYCAMYMGEGQALLESKAIATNLEDGRVPAWLQRGADNLLPILSPVDPNAFYAWRRKQKYGT